MGETATIDAGQQHLRALEHANKVRLARAEMKRGIASGDLRVVDVVVDCPWQVESMSISDLLMSQKRWGRARCRRLLLSIGIPENKTIGSMTDRQRSALADLLRSKRPSASPADSPFRALTSV
jgi:hypothetical protein